MDGFDFYLVQQLGKLIEGREASPDMANVTVPKADDTCSKQALKDFSCPSSTSGSSENIAVLSLLKVMLPAICDSAYQFCDEHDERRTTCPNTMCCRMCNIVKAIHHCYKKYDTDQFIDRIFLNMREGYDFERAKGSRMVSAKVQSTRFLKAQN